MYRPHCVRSVLTTSVKILSYRPPARLIRANYSWSCDIRKPWVLLASWLFQCSCILDSPPIYFLNFDRCAYGGRTDSSMYSPEDARPVRGPTYLASYGNCSRVFSFMWNQWKPFNGSHIYRYGMPCSCSAVKTLACNWIVLLLSFSTYCFLAYH